MAYKIQYSAITAEKYIPVKRGRLRKRWMIMIFSIVLLGGLFIARKPLRSVLFPGDPEVTDAAVKKMVQSLREGEGLYEAVSVFCLEVLENGQQDSN